MKKRRTDKIEQYLFMNPWQPVMNVCFEALDTPADIQRMLDDARQLLRLVEQGRVIRREIPICGLPHQAGMPLYALAHEQSAPPAEWNIHDLALPPAGQQQEVSHASA